MKLRGMKLSGFFVVAIAAAIAGCTSTSSQGFTDQGPGATPTATPATEPQPADTPEVATPAAAVFATIKLTGKGDKVAKFTIPENEAAIATFTNKGDSNFIVESLAANGSTNALLVNVIGSYKGTVLFDTALGEQSIAFKIGSNGSWTATIKPISAARAWSGTDKLTGKGDDVVLVDPPISGLTTATFTYRGSSNFVVVSYTTGDSNLLINEIGTYTGQVQIPDGTVLLAISADGAWTATPD